MLYLCWHCWLYIDWIEFLRICDDLAFDVRLCTKMIDESNDRMRNRYG